MDISKTIILAIILVSLSYGLQRNIGINLADEGYLWYGTWRTVSGELPKLDFRGYDPARYFWTAGWSLIFGDGILALRTSGAIFQTIGLLFGLLVLRRVFRSSWMLCLAGILLLVWMFPRHKLFEPSIAMAAVYFAVLLIEKPSLLRHFAAGIFVGISAFFGVNLGFYTFTSFFCLHLFVWLKIEKSSLLKRILIWATGVFFGYSPMLFLFLFVPGLFLCYINNVLDILSRESLNIPLRVPWPWLLNFSNITEIGFAETLSTGIFFLLMPIFAGLSLPALLWLKYDKLNQNAPFVASVFISLSYMHHAFSRADIYHLAQAIHPCIIGILSLPFIFHGPRKKQMFSTVLIVTLAILSYFSVVSKSPYFRKLSSPPGSFVPINIKGDNLWVEKWNAQIINSMKKINNRRVHPEEGLLIAPHWPGMYPILNKKSPLFDTYFLWKASVHTQRKQISDLNRNQVNWVVLGDVKLDGRDDLRFKNTHALLWLFIIENFEPVSVEGLPQNYQLLKRTSRFLF